MPSASVADSEKTQAKRVRFCGLNLEVGLRWYTLSNGKGGLDPWRIGQKVESLNARFWVPLADQAGFANEVPLAGKKSYSLAALLAQRRKKSALWLLALPQEGEKPFYWLWVWHKGRLYPGFTDTCYATFHEAKDVQNSLLPLLGGEGKVVRRTLLKNDGVPFLQKKQAQEHAQKEHEIEVFVGKTPAESLSFLRQELAWVRSKACLGIGELLPIHVLRSQRQHVALRFVQKLVWLICLTVVLIFGVAALKELSFKEPPTLVHMDAHSFFSKPWEKVRLPSLELAHGRRMIEQSRPFFLGWKRTEVQVLRTVRGGAVFLHPRVIYTHTPWASYLSLQKNAQLSKDAKTLTLEGEAFKVPLETQAQAEHLLSKEVLGRFFLELAQVFKIKSTLVFEQPKIKEVPNLGLLRCPWVEGHFSLIDLHFADLKRVGLLFNDCAGLFVEELIAKENRLTLKGVVYAQTKE